MVMRSAMKYLGNGLAASTAGGMYFMRFPHRIMCSAFASQWNNNWHCKAYIVDMADSSSIDFIMADHCTGWLPQPDLGLPRDASSISSADV